MPSAQGRLRSRARKLKFKSPGIKLTKIAPFRLLVTFLILIIGLLLISFSWKVYLGYKNKLWDGKTRITVVIAKEDPEVYSLEPATGTLIRFSIPKNTQIEASNKLGKWYVGSLWKLGLQKGLEGEVLRRSVQKSLGLPVDAWIDEGGETLFTSSSLGKFGALKKAVLTGTLQTNLTFFDRLNLLGAASGDISEREISLTATRVVIKTKLTDGEEAYAVMPDQANVTFEKFMRDDIVFAETKTVSVLNTGGKQGLGGEVTRVAQVLGARVIGARASDEKYGGVCKIRGEADAIVSVSAARIAELFNCELEKSQPRGPATMEIILGEKFVEEF